MRKLQSAAVAAAALAAAGLVVIGVTAKAATAAPAHSTQAATAASDGGSARANERVVEAFIQDVLNEHHEASGFFTPDATWTGGTVGTVTGGQNVAGLFDAATTSVPDEHATLIDIFGAGDQVAVHVVLSGTQEGPVVEIPATGRHLQWNSIDIFRISHGKIASIQDGDDWTAILYETGTYTPPWIS
jgi:predicted ester cyclase